MQQYYDQSYGNKAISQNRTGERKLSNKCKSIVIRSVIQPMITSDTWVNDFSCGKMQDFNKWQAALTPNWHPSDNRIKLIGSDISPKGIEEGNQRISQAGLTGWFKAFECDLLSSKLDPEHHLTKMLEFEKDRHNVLSMQLAAHYAFQSQERFDNLIHNMMISNPSSIFITIPDPDRILNPDLNLENASVSNIELSSTPFGNRYTYQQSGPRDARHKANTKQAALSRWRAPARECWRGQAAGSSAAAHDGGEEAAITGLGAGCARTGARTCVEAHLGALATPRMCHSCSGERRSCRATLSPHLSCL